VCFGRLIVDDDDDGVVIPEKQDLSKELFRGLEFEKWFYIFMQVSAVEEVD
jgi:hypothetical protein